MMGNNTETLRLKARDDTRKAFNSIKKNVSSLDRIAKQARGGIAGIAGGAALVGLGSLAKKSIDAADAVEKLSRRTGGSAKFLSEMRFALSQNDATMSDFQNTLRKINKSAQDAADGLSTPTRAFQKLGIDVDAFNKLNTDQKFIQLSEAISKVEDPAKRTQTAMDIMGRAGERLLPTMIDGAEGIAAYREEAERMGLSLTEDQVKGAAAANDAIDKLTSSIGGSISQAILPYTDSIIKAADFTREYLPRAIEFLIDMFRGLKVVFNGIVLTIQTKLQTLFELAAKLPIVGENFDNLALSFKAAAEGSKKSIDETIGNMGKWRESSKDAADAVGQAANVVEVDFSTAVNDATNSVIGATAAADKATEAARRLKEEKKAEAEALREANRAMREAEAEAKRYATATGQDLLRTQEDINRVLDEADLYTKNYALALQQAEQIITSRGLIKGTDEFNAALESLGFTIEEVEDKTESTTATIATLWENSVGTVQGTLQSFFEEGIGGFDNWFDSVLGSLKKFLAAFLAQWAASGILTLAKSFGSQDGLDWSGFSLSNAFGSGGGGNGSGAVQAGAAVAGQIFGQQAGQTFNNVATGVGGVGSVVGGFNQIDAGLDQGGTSGAINVISGAASIWQGASTVAGLVSGGATAAATAATAATAASASAATAATSTALAASINATVGTAAAASAATVGTAAATAATATTAAAASSAAVATGAATTAAAAGSAAAASGSAAAATTAAASAGSTVGASIAAAVPYIAAAIAVVAVLDSVFGGGRSPAEILRDERNETFGGDDGILERIAPSLEGGFATGNTGNFGGTFGIENNGTLTSQHLVDGAAYFQGAQQGLKEFEAYAASKGFDTFLDEGTLRVLGATSDQMLEMWETWAHGLDEAVGASQAAATAFENNLIDPTNFFYENLVLVSGKGAIEVREMVADMDTSFERFKESGLSNTDAVYAAMAEGFGITTEQAKQFFQESGQSAENWAAQFESNTEDMIFSMLDFNEQGKTAFQELVTSAEDSAQSIVGSFDSQLTGAISNINLGQFNIPSASFNVTAEGVSSSQSVPFLGNFANGGSFTVPDTGRGPSDQPFFIGLQRGERVTVEPNKKQASNNSRDSEVQALKEMVADLVGQVSNLTSEIARSNNKKNAFSHS